MFVVVPLPDLLSFYATSVQKSTLIPRVQFGFILVLLDLVSQPSPQLALSL